MPRESAQDWGLLNNSQTMMNVTAPNQRLQMSNGQPQIAVNNPSVVRYSHQAQTVQLQQSSYQSVTDSSVKIHNRSCYCCQALQLKQASNQAQAQIPNANAHYISNQGSNGYIQSSQCSLNNCKVKKSFQRLTLRNKNVVQVYPPNPVHHEQQNNQTNRMLNTEYSVVEPKQNDQIPSGMNCQNRTRVSSERLVYRIISGQALGGNSTATSHSMTSSRLCSNMPNSAPVSSAVNVTPPSYHDTILSRSSAHSNQKSPSLVDNQPNLASPGLYTNSPTRSSLVPSGINRLQSPHSQTHSLAAMSNNMNASSSGYCGFLPATASNNGCSLPPHLMSGSPSSVDTNQTDLTSSGNSSRNAGRPPTHPNSSSVHGAPVQQQSPPFDSAQRTLRKELPRNVDVLSNHTPNMADKLPKAMKENNPLLLHLLVKDSMQNTDQNIECNDYNAPIMPVSPSRSVQTHRAVAVVPPISKQPAGGDKRMECNDHLSLLMKDIQFLSNGKETQDVETDCAPAKTLPGVTSSVVGCPSEDDATDKSAICCKGNPVQNLSPENKDISKDENSKQSSEAHAFFGIPVETFSLRMVRELVVGLDLAEEDQGKTNESGLTENTPDFARFILDLYWGGKYNNYFEAELGGTFEKVLEEAAEFDTDKDVKVFDAMKVEDLNWLNQMGCTLTNFCDGGAAMEVNESSWRNNDDESLDIDKALSHFMRQVHGSLKQHSDNQSPATKSLNEESVSKEDLQSSSSVAESDTVFLENENCTVTAMQAKHVKLDSQDELNQNMAIPTTSKNNSQDDSRQDDKEDYLSLQVQVSLGNLNGHSNQDHACADPLRDTVHKTPEKCENKSSRKCFRGGSDCTATLKTTNSSSEDFINLGGNSKDSNCKKYLNEEDCTLSVSLCEQVEQSEKECGTSPCDAMSHIKLTVLSSEIESEKVDSENQHQDLIISGQKGPPSPIVISESDLVSPKSPDDPLLSMQITVLSRDELQALAVEFYSDSENNVHNAGISSLICVDSEDDDSQLDSVHSCQTDEETSQMTKQEEISTLIGEEIPSMHSIKEALSLLQTNMTENQNNHMDNSAGKEPISHCKDSRKRKDPQERHLQNEQDQHTSQLCHSPPLKKCRVEPLGDFEKSVKLAAGSSPSGQSIQDMATKYSQKSDADMTKTPDNKIHSDDAVSLSAALSENVLNRAGSSGSPEMPKSAGVEKKRKSVTFKLYGSQKVVVKETNGKTQNYTGSDHNLPPVLNILYSPDKTSARDKIKKSWEDSFVPATIKFKRRSGSVSENREKDVLERPVEWHQKSSGEKNQRSSGKEHKLDRKLGKDKDEQWQQQSSETKHKSKHKKRKHKSLSLTELRREAEKMGKSSKSPQEKQKMGLHIIKQYKRIHKKM